MSADERLLHVFGRSRVNGIGMTEEARCREVWPREQWSSLSTRRHRFYLQNPRDAQDS